MKVINGPKKEDLAHLHILSAPWGIGTYIVRENGEEFEMYGFYRTKNPHDFRPDVESCRPEEIENHRKACEWWDSTHPK